MLSNKTLSQLREGSTLKDLGIDISAVKKAYPLYSNTFTNTFGVEIEFLSLLPAARIIEMAENMRLSLTYNHRRSNDYTDNRITSDSSIRSTAALNKYIEDIAGKASTTEKVNYSIYGHEVVSKILRLTEIDTIKNICKLLNTKLTQYNNISTALINETCGLHIHLGIEDLSEEQKASCYHLFKTLEPYIYNLVPQHRHKNTYCNSVLGIPFSERLSRDKYYTINISSRLNTFEYRLFNSTTNYYTIYHIIYIIFYIYYYGKTNDVLYDSDVNLYDVLQNPILWNFYNERKRFIDNLSSDIASMNKEELTEINESRLSRPQISSIRRRFPVSL